MVDIAAELPLEVIAELIGVPHDDRLKIFDWSNRMIGSEDPEYAVSDEEAFNAQVEMFMYAQQLAEEHRQKPSDDIITALLSAEIDGESLSDMDFNLFFMLLSVAGQRDHPQRHRPRHERVPREPGPVGPAEVRRRRAHQGRHRGDPPLGVAGHVLPPQRHEGLQLREHTIKAGDKISLWYISANRDEDVWDDPFTLRHHPRPEPAHRLRRRRPALLPRRAAGPHGDPACCSRSWSRRVDRVEGLARPDRLRSNFIGGIKHLPVRFHTS